MNKNRNAALQVSAVLLLACVCWYFSHHSTASVRQVAEMTQVEMVNTTDAPVAETNTVSAQPQPVAEVVQAETVTNAPTVQTNGVKTVKFTVRPRLSGSSGTR